MVQQDVTIEINGNIHLKWAHLFHYPESLSQQGVAIISMKLVAYLWSVARAIRQEVGYSLWWDQMRKLLNLGRPSI